MFHSISEYAPLIQLIVGSVFLNAFYNYNRWHLLTTEQKEAIQTFTPPESGLREMYLDNNSTQKSVKSQKKLFKSVLVIFTLFGCICLFYCATCHNANNITKYDVSCFGPFLSIAITIVYFLWAVAIYGHNWRPWYSYVTYGTFSLLVLTFLVFICIIPDFLFDKLEPIRSFITVLIMGTLLIWFTFYAKKWLLIHVQIPYWMDVVRFLQLMLPQTSTPTHEKFENIFTTIEEHKMKLRTKWLLLIICGKYLKSHELYCLNKENGVTVESSDINSRIKDLKVKIKNSRLRKLEKRWLINKIPNKKVSITVSKRSSFEGDREKYSTKKGMKIVRKLAQFGAYEKVEAPKNSIA